MKFKFYKATQSDSSILFDWRNDPLTRAQSHTNEVINLQSHQQWFLNSLSNPDREIFIIYDSKDAVGMIRRDRVDRSIPEEWILSWLVNPDFRGKGFGKEILFQFVRLFPSRYFAEIKNSNFASISMVKFSGFKVCKLFEEYQLWIYEEN